MADIERTTVDHRDSSPVWIVVALLVAVLLIAMFIWPGWVNSPFAPYTESDTTIIEQPDQNVDIEQPQPDQDINVEQPDINIEQPDEAPPSADTTP